MGSAAVADLVERTDHEVTVGDIRTDAALATLRRIGAPERVVRVDVEDPRELAAAPADTETVLNATYMRHNLPVTDAAIAAMCSGVVPQQPPSRLTRPLAANSPTMAAV